MSEKKTYSKGVALILATIFGPLGADKFYIGSYGLGIAQLISSILIVGLLWSGPYAFISILTLICTILFGINTFLYPEVNWAPTTQTDKIIAWILIVFYLVTFVTIKISKKSVHSDAHLNIQILPDTTYHKTSTYHKTYRTGNEPVVFNLKTSSRKNRLII